ncbi:MAG: hypothetical protein AAF141_16165 [Pseudomonadota bacterium]
MKFIFQLIVFAALAFALPNATAQEETREGTGNNSSSSSSGGGQTSSSGQAKAAQLAQIIGAGANVAMGAAMMAKCGPHCGWCCAAGAMSFANAASMMANAGQSGNTAGALDDWDPGDVWGDLELPNYPGIDPLNPGGGPIDGADDVTRIIDAGTSLGEQYGYSFDQETGMLSTPDNGSFTPDVLNDPAAAAAQGFGASGMELGQGEAVALSAAFNDNLKKKGLLDALNRPSVSGVGVDTGGGGGGGYGGGKSSFGTSGFGDYLNKMKRGLASKKPAVIAGKSKMLGGERIGVKVDDIFAMVHRRYQAKRKSNDFIEKGAKGNSNKK